MSPTTTRRLAPALVATLAIAVAVPVHGQRLPLPYGPNIGVDQAKALATAAIAEARKNDWTIVVAIVDTGGHLVYLERMDHTQIASVDVARRKAWTANSFKRSTKAFEDAVAGGRMATLSMPDAVLIEGGVPIVVDGRIVGAIGISGATSQQDGQVAAAALAVLK
jgi:uncharacterized protein GlcG (DUF336 family)